VCSSFTRGGKGLHITVKRNCMKIRYRVLFAFLSADVENEEQ